MKRKIVLIIVLAFLLLGGCGISVRVVETESVSEEAQNVYADEPDEDAKRQLEIFAQAKDEWTMQDYGNLLVGYAVYDLDRDGKLELITQAIMGTGLYSENHFYQVNAAGDGIVEVPQTYYEEYAELEIEGWNNELALIDEESGIIRFLRGKNVVSV